jgi:hypothetical protein
MAQVTHTRAKFDHDCTCCTFMAHVVPDQGEAFDLYQHGDDVLARTSDDGPDYRSMPLDYAPHFANDTKTTMGRAFWMYRHLTRKRFHRAA